MFFADLHANKDILFDMIAGKRVLAIGAAGSIGSNTINTISYFKPKSLHIIDQNENALAELVRFLRSRKSGFDIEDFRTLPLNYGSQAFEYYLKENTPFDYVLNFAALKHVRSEKDNYSILEMLNTNLLMMSKLLFNLSRLDSPKRFFSVSTDKAANPSSIMGASKRLMEHFLFNNALPRPEDMAVTSARFANVAYSNGSLLQSFKNRLDLRQPLVAPKNCRRYFVSLEESGHICTLASFLAPHQTILVPNLEPSRHLVLLEDILFRFLEIQKLTPIVLEDEQEARNSVEKLAAEKKWPVVLTPLDTAGEKAYEEFVAQNEQISNVGFSSLSGIRYQPSPHGDLSEFKKSLEQLSSSDIFKQSTDLGQNKSFFTDLIGSIEPDFLESHHDSNENLDQRM